MMYSKIQKEILARLLQKYENSKTYANENAIKQSFSVRPEDFMKDYQSDFTDIAKIAEFEQHIALLEEEKFVETKRKNGRIQKISAILDEENWKKIRSILGVKEKKEAIEEEKLFYRQFLQENEIIKNFCTVQIERLENGKNSQYERSEAERIIALLQFILSNKEEILERELSIAVLSDSKLWEKKYKSKVCRILWTSPAKSHAELDSASRKEFPNQVRNDETQETDENLLEEFNIYKNPTYIYFKGNGKITFADKTEILLSKNRPLAFPSSSLKEIEHIRIFDGGIMTVENLTSFNRIAAPDIFYIYLSGYHNSAKQKFLCKIHSENPEKQYFHFGDIDPDGFDILENLREKTKINFVPYKMDVQTLKKYRDFAKPLEKNDIAKAQTLISKNHFADEMNYMLSCNCKLEQEIVSWKER